MYVYSMAIWDYAIIAQSHNKKCLNPPPPPPPHIFTTLGLISRLPSNGPGRCDSLMVSTLISVSSSLDPILGRGHCVVFVDKTLYTRSTSLHPGL